MRNSKQMLLIIFDDTNWDRGMLNFEIEKAADFYKIPIIITYVKHGRIVNLNELEKLWHKALYERISNETAKCIHIPFKRVVIDVALSQFVIHSNKLSGSLCYYDLNAYDSWGIY